jgi:hypothetical protein
MGGLIPIGGGADAEIKGLLNTAFDDTNIVIVRGQMAKENLFDGNHHLHRLAYRLGAYPVRTYKGESAKAQGKWFYFLKTTLKGPAKNSIKAILSYAMTNPGSAVARVVFDARPGDPKTNPDHYIDGPTPNPMNPADISQLVDTSGTLLVALICPQSLSMSTAAVPNQQGDIDNGEQPPAKIFTPTALASPVLDKKTRKPIKKQEGAAAKKTKVRKRSRK